MATSDDLDAAETRNSNGMGLAAACRLAAAGASLGICDLNNNAGQALIKDLQVQYPMQDFLVGPPCHFLYYKCVLTNIHYSSGK